MNRSNFQTRRKIYLFLLNTLGIPRETATRLVKFVARYFNRTQERQRNGAAAVAANASYIDVPEEIGFRKLSQNELPGTAALVQACQEVFTAYRNSGRLAQRMAFPGSGR
jgi:hypothetical protein